jgi:DNA polymerase III sliding clamp (beta) subunit (PCNA family)
MKRTDLINILAIANTCIAENPIAPALSYVQFTGQEIRAFNGIQAVSTQFETEFPFIVQGKFLETFLKSLTTTDIELTMNGEYLNIKSGKMKVQLDTLDPQDFLFAKEKDEEDEIFNLTPNFIRGLKECLAFASSEQVKETQNGVYLLGKNIYSTDGNRIAKSNNGAKDDCNIFLPEKFCTILLKIKKEACDGVLLVNSNSLSYYDGEIVLQTARPAIELLDFNFFDKYTQKEENYFVIPDEMRDIFDRASLVLGNETNKVLNVNILDTEWTFTATSSSTRYEETVATTMNYFGGIEFSVNLPMLTNSIKYAEKMALFISNESCFLLLKNKEEDFAAVVAAI